MTVNTSSNPTKKRKVNDGRDDVSDGAQDVSNGGGFLSSWFGYFAGRGCDASPSTSGANNTSQLDRMEQMMRGIEDKLATVSSLERRCEQLEAKCISLESKLESTSQSVKDHVDSKIDSMIINLDQRCSSLENKLEGKMDSLDAKVDSFLKYREYNTMLLSKVDGKVDSVDAKVDRAMKYHEYNTMLVKNQSWEYSPVIHSYDWLDNNYESAFLVRSAEALRKKAIAMRRGEFPDVDESDKGVCFYMGEASTEYVDENFRAHWREFAAALKQFTPAMNLLPCNGERFFELESPVMDSDMMMLLKEALVGKPFTELAFGHNTDADVDLESGGMHMDAIFDIIHSNKHLRRLRIRRNRILINHIDRLCSIVRNYPLVELNLWDSIDCPVIGNAMLTALLTCGNLQLEILNVGKCNITSDVIIVLADFIATNPRLKDVNLKDNRLNDNDAVLIANALRSNRKLRHLELGGNDGITKSGSDAFRSVLYDESSLNAIADSNHCCLPEFNGIHLDDNSSELMERNRGSKIYSLLSERHMTMMNVQHFSDIDVNILPNMLEAVQKYQRYDKSWYEEGDYGDSDSASSLSIMYEVMRNWDKVVSLYE